MRQIRGGFVRFFSQFVEKIPIPTATESQKTQLATLAKTCQTAAEQRYKLQQGLTRRIPDLAPARAANQNFPPGSRNGGSCPISPPSRAEVKKCLKTEIPLKERNDWEDWIARDHAEIARLTAEIKASRRPH